MHLATQDFFLYFVKKKKKKKKLGKRLFKNFSACLFGSKSQSQEAATGE